MLESFMEDLLWEYPDEFWPGRGFKKERRQHSLSEAGRLDISFRDSNERLWVVEVKAVPIRIADADQVDRYARKLRENHPNDPPIPAVVAPVINSTVRENFDRWGIEHFEISEATFRRVATEKGISMEQEPASPSSQLAPRPRSAAANWTYVPLLVGRGAIDGQKANGTLWAKPGKYYVHYTDNPNRAYCGRQIGGTDKVVATLTRLKTNWVWVDAPVTCDGCLARMP